MLTVKKSHYDCLRCKLVPSKLYVALQYPRSESGIDMHELHPEFLPPSLRANTEEPEYIWSFVLAFMEGTKLWFKHYTIVRRLGAATSPDPHLRAISIPNTSLNDFGWNIETARYESHRLNVIPRLTLLDEVHDLPNFEADSKAFETFLRNHRFSRESWFAYGESHAWAREVLVKYEAIRVNEETICTGEAAARTAIKQHQSQSPSCFKLKPKYEEGEEEEEEEEGKEG